MKKLISWAKIKQSAPINQGPKQEESTNKPKVISMKNIRKGVSVNRVKDEPAKSLPK